MMTEATAAQDRDRLRRGPGARGGSRSRISGGSPRRSRQLLCTSARKGAFRRADVEDLVAETRERGVFELTKAIGEGNTARALTLLGNMLAKPGAAPAHPVHAGAAAPSESGGRRSWPPTTCRATRSPPRSGSPPSSSTTCWCRPPHVGGRARAQLPPPLPVRPHTQIGRRIDPRPLHRPPGAPSSPTTPAAAPAERPNRARRSDGTRLLRQAVDRQGQPRYAPGRRARL